MIFIERKIDIYLKVREQQTDELIHDIETYGAYLSSIQQGYDTKIMEECGFRNKKQIVDLKMTKNGIKMSFRFRWIEEII